MTTAVAAVDHDTLLQNVAAWRALVRTIMWRHGYATATTYDDLHQAGMIAVWESLLRFDHERGVQFETFVTHRIHGAIHDEVRREDRLVRSDREFLRDVSAAHVRLERRLGCQPRAAELAAEAGVSLDEYHKRMLWVVSAPLSESDVRVGGREEDVDPFDAADESLAVADQRAENIEQVRAAVARLPDRLRNLVGRLYDDEAESQDVAAELGVTPSRVSQLHKAALRKLRVLIAA